MPDTLRDRAEATARDLEAEARKTGMTVSGDKRVSEADAARLLGLEGATESGSQHPLP